MGMELFQRTCPKCGGNRVRDIEKFTPTGWAFVAAAAAVMVLGTAALACSYVSAMSLGGVVIVAGGMIVFARNQHMVEAHHCGGCGNKGVFPLQKEFDQKNTQGPR